MPSFADSIFLFVLALLLFGPKKLPVLARELGKWVGEFRRASNEFKMQMDEELRLSEQSDRQKQIAAMEAAAPLPPPLEEPEHPHLPRTIQPEAVPTPNIPPMAASLEPATPAVETPAVPATEYVAEETIDGVRPIPIASSGDLHMMPPSTGLPMARSRNGNPLGGLLDSIPESEAPEPAFAQNAQNTTQTAPETATHAD